MYCIECGAQIPENSKFCSHCGKQQIAGEPSVKEKIAEKIIETEIVRQVVQEHKKSLDYQFLRKSMGYYLAWVLMHLTFLLIFSDGIFDSSNSDDGLDDFWPFDKLHDYDMTEFLVYSIFPLVVLIIWSMIRSQSDDSNTAEE